MAWRAALSGLALAVALAPPAASGQNGAATDEAVILSPYGSYKGANSRPRRARHAGVDFAGPLGAPVLAAADGVVSRIINWPPGCGNGVVIEHGRFKRWTAYCHMQSVAVQQGQTVTRGEPIGLIGTSGNAVNVPHVHMELCTIACSSHVDGNLSGTTDPLAVAAGCFDPGGAYPLDRLALTFPVPCRSWSRGR